MSWLNMLQTAEIAVWACDTAKNIILAILNLVPDTYPEGADPVLMFKQMSRAM